MDEKDILRTYREGDTRRAFEEIVRAYKERLYWHVRSLVGSHEDTDDILQEIFIKIWAALPSFRGDAQLFTWIYRIATNEALNFLKKQRLRSIFSSSGSEDDGMQLADRLQADPYFDGTEAQRLLCVAISKLPPKQRAVFVMRYQDEMKYEDIAEITGTSVSALKASYHFAYEKVKDFLTKKND